MAQIFNTGRQLTCDEISYEVRLSGVSVYRILVSEYEKDHSAKGTPFSIGILETMAGNNLQGITSQAWNMD